MQVTRVSVGGFLRNPQVRFRRNRTTIEKVNTLAVQQDSMGSDATPVSDADLQAVERLGEGHRRILADPDFRAGRIDTTYVQRFLSKEQKKPEAAVGT